MSRTAADLDALLAEIPELQGWPLSVRELSGGITNRNYLVSAGADRYVVRVPGRDSERLGIDRRAEWAASLAAAAAGVGPEVVRFLEPAGCLVTRYIEGAPLQPEDIARPETIARVARALRRFHQGPALPSTFSPFAVATSYLATAQSLGLPVPPAVLFAMERAEEMARAVARSGAGSPAVPCHNDLLLGNFIDDGERIWIVDWEYAGMGNRFFDLGNLSINNDFDDDQDRLLLEQSLDQPRPGDLALLKLMRIASDLREGMWGLVQSRLSDLDFDFTGYSQHHLERLRQGASDPRYPRWLEALGSQTTASGA